MFYKILYFFCLFQNPDPSILLRCDSLSIFGCTIVLQNSICKDNNCGGADSALAVTSIMSFIAVVCFGNNFSSSTKYTGKMFHRLERTSTTNSNQPPNTHPPSPIFYSYPRNRIKWKIAFPTEIHHKMTAKQLQNT